MHLQKFIIHTYLDDRTGKLLSWGAETSVHAKPAEWLDLDYMYDSDFYEYLGYPVGKTMYMYS